LHLAPIVLVVLAIALVMAPAALHRQTSQRVVSERFVWLSSMLLLASMFPLVVALCMEVYLIGGSSWRARASRWRSPPSCSAFHAAVDRAAAAGKG